MVLQNGISIGISKKHIRIVNKFDCVEGVRVIQPVPKKMRLEMVNGT